MALGASVGQAIALGRARGPLGGCIRLGLDVLRLAGVGGPDQQKVAPRPASLSTQIRPPINSTKRAQIDKPSPDPP